MIVLGLTGSIGMGKSTAAKMLRRMGVPVHEADKAIHRLLRGSAVKPVQKAFPSAVRRGRIDRAELGRLVFNDKAALKRLEAILHPLVRRTSARWLGVQRRAGKKLAVLDIPLLFEAGREKECDAVIVVSAPPDVQKARVLARPGMTPAKLKGILARQMSDAEKRKRADFVVPTRSEAETERLLRRIVARYKGKS